ncbi:hypothetical protein Tco_0963370 [Tanacetum coccineum]
MSLRGHPIKLEHLVIDRSGLIRLSHVIPVDGNLFEVRNMSEIFKVDEHQIEVECQEFCPKNPKNSREGHNKASCVNAKLDNLQNPSCIKRRPPKPKTTCITNVEDSIFAQNVTGGSITFEVGGGSSCKSKTKSNKLKVRFVDTGMRHGMGMRCGTGMRAGMGMRGGMVKRGEMRIRGEIVHHAQPPIQFAQATIQPVQPVPIARVQANPRGGFVRPK